jgi:hypothetical protein
MYDMLASFIGINATVNNISAMMYNMAVLLVFNANFSNISAISWCEQILLLT